MNSQTRPTGAALTFRLSAPSDRLEADLLLRPFGERWVAVAECAGRRDVGVGADPRTAVTASLGRFRARARAEMLADLSLLEVSRLLLAGAMG